MMAEHEHAMLRQSLQRGEHLLSLVRACARSIIISAAADALSANSSGSTYKRRRKAQSR